MIKLNRKRNPVASAHRKLSTGSGVHKDKSKTIPRKQKYRMVGV